MQGGSAMHYQSHLVPLNERGDYLFATCHGQYAIGGEDTRETAYARLLVGNASDLTSLRDIRHCLPSRPACSAQVRAHELDAAGQDGYAREKGVETAAGLHYLRNARQMRHAARLAGIDMIRVPRERKGSGLES
jgi:hypothetical protein